VFVIYIYTGMALYTARPPNKVTVASGSSEHLLDADNPYLNTDGVPLLPSLESRIDVPEDLIVKAYNLEKMACPVKVLCIFDCAMNAYYIFFNPLMGIVLCMVSFNGYLATVYFKRSLFLCYLLYQYLQVVGRLGLLVISIEESIHGNNSTVSNYTGNNSVVLHIIDPPGNPFLLTAMFLLQSYIAYFVTRFYCNLPTRADLSRVGYVAL